MMQDDGKDDSRTHNVPVDFKVIDRFSSPTYSRYHFIQLKQAKIE
jgi:hypothetical protein